jgi:predicted transcriptional regulator
MGKIFHTRIFYRLGILHCYLHRLNTSLHNVSLESYFYHQQYDNLLSKRRRYEVYRNRNEIISQILDTANCADGIAKSKMMFKAYLSHDQLQEYTILLIDNGMLQYDTPMRTFRTTEKGRAFIQAYGQIDQMLKKHQS